MKFKECVLKMKYVENWCNTEKAFTAWWNRSKINRPLMRIISKRNQPIEELEIINQPQSPFDQHLNVDYHVKSARNYCKTHKFMAEAFPTIDINIGPGSMATYLGSEPVFAWDTIWYEESIHDWSKFEGLKYDEDNRWWKLHRELVANACQMAGGDIPVTIPDIIENIDIVSAFRGPQNMCYDLMDEYDAVKKCLKDVDDLYFKYYDVFYESTKLADNSSFYTAFSIWGPGKVAKVQCDFSAMMSPGMFEDLVIPSLQRQCSNLDHSIYHLDGPDAIKHLDALMKIEKLDGLQWTCGAGKPDGANELWYPIYEKVRKAEKSLWIAVYDGDFADWVANTDKLVNKFGSDGLYLLFPEMEEEQALRLIAHAEKNWR